MSTKGTAAKSASGASMSKYDVEVEGRLQKLEAALGSSGEVDGDRLAALESKVDDLIQRLQRKLSF